MFRSKLLSLGAVLFLLLTLTGCGWCEAYFTWPDRNPSSSDPKNQILQLIANAKKTIDAAVFVITDNDIEKQLGKAHDRGVKIRVVIDAKYIDRCDSLPNGPYGNGIDFRKNIKGQEMHHKYAIFDSAAVVTGSYNWSKTADQENFEDIVIIHDREIIKAYQNEFDSILWSDTYTTPYMPRSDCS